MQVSATGIVMVTYVYKRMQVKEWWKAQQKKGQQKKKGQEDGQTDLPEGV